MDDLRFRQVHLDFHTGPALPGVGEHFDAEAFADQVASASVDSITLFAKCHHGHLYYETTHPAKHPNLTRNLLTEQVAALHARAIRCPIYLSVQCDEYAANTHPEWIALNPDGSRVGRRPLANDDFQWQILDMASPYLDYLCAQTEEVLRKFAPVDGLFFDMCWDQPSVSAWALAKMKTWGLNPASESDRATYASRLAAEYMERLTTLAERFQPGVPIWFNSRPINSLRDQQAGLRHVEIEALPTGFWGYAYFPVYVRYARPLGLPMIGMTGRFHKSWADFGGLRTVPSLLYDCAHALAHGAGCSVGDQMHPAGLLDGGAYSVIGAVYDHVKKCEPWCRQAAAPKELAVLFVDPALKPDAARVHEGAWRVLAPLGWQFVFLPAAERFEEYPAVYVPETVTVDAALEGRLDTYVAAGGRVIQEMSAGEASPFARAFCRFEAGFGGTLPPSDHVFYERGVRLCPEDGDTVLARVVEPYFERTWEHFCSHAQTPSRLDASPYAAALVRGGRALLAFPVLRSYALHGNLACRQLVAAALDGLGVEPLLRLDGPRYVEGLVNHLPDADVVHLLSFIPQKRTPTMEVVEETVPACDLAVSLRTDRPVVGATLQPSGEALPFHAEGGRVTARADRIDGHALVVFSYSSSPK
jgi:hypothetical protein